MAAVAWPPTQQLMNAALLSEGLSCMSNCNKIMIKERFNIFEAIASTLGEGTNTRSQYRIFRDDDEEIFFAVEKAGLRRWFLQTCFPDCAPWDVDIYITENRESVTPGHSAFTLHRPCSFSFICCNTSRPVIDVTDVETGVRLGSIKEPFVCCDYKFILQGSDDKTVMEVDGENCQWGLCCSSPCGPCSEVDLQVRQTNSGSTAHVQRKMPLCSNFLLRKEQEDTNYVVDFGTLQAPEDKALLMALAIHIDFKFFHIPSDDDSDAWQWFNDE